MARILKNHAPLITREIIIRPAAPWYIEEIKSKKRIRRKLERIWRKSKLSCDRLKYNQQCRRVSALLSESRTHYYSEIVKDNECNQRKLFKTFGKLLYHNPQPQYPTCRFGENLADNFMTFFEDKINKIHEDLMESSPFYQTCISDVPLSSCKLEKFDVVTPEELLLVSSQIAKKSCHVDPLPAKLLLKSLRFLNPVV